MNELLTAYLRALYTLRGGRLSAADAMNHIVDLLSAAQATRGSLAKLLSLGSHGPASRGGDVGMRETSGGDGHA